MNPQDDLSFRRQSTSSNNSQHSENNMNLKGKRILVCGAGGSIGALLVKNLLASGAAAVRAVDVKAPNEEHRSIERNMIGASDLRTQVDLQERYATA